MIRKVLMLSGFLWVATASFAQETEAFSMLNLSVSAREAALGGKLVAADFDDAQLQSYSPQLISEANHGAIYAHYLNFLGDLGATEFNYTHKHSKLPVTLMAGARVFSYGDFNATNVFGETTGSFSARDQVFYVSAGYNRAGPWNYGLSLKFLNSTYEQYTANALAFDLGVQYRDTAKQFAAGIQLSNAGIMLNNFIDTRQKLPLNVALGISKKLDKAPFRFIFTLDNLQQWDIPLPEDDAPVQDPLTGEVIEPEEKTPVGEFFRNFGRHLYAGTEIVFSKAFQARIGYNYLRRRELSISEKPGTVGISWGLSFRINRFHFHYARSAYHLSGASNFFSLTTNFFDFWRKENTQSWPEKQ